MIAYILIAVLAISVIFLLWHAFYIHGKYKAFEGKIKFMIASIANADYAFSFRTDNVKKGEKMVNENLNLVSEMLKRARNEAIERERFYELIMNSVRTGILVVDNEGRILRSNDSALQLVGLQVLTYTEQIGRVSAELKAKVESIKPGERQQATILNERGTTSLQLQASQTMLKGKHVRIVALNDINSALDQNELDSWTKLIRVLTHEIMNTVAPITSLSQTLIRKIKEERLEGAVGATSIIEGLEVIEKTSRGLTEFVENYRKLTHVPTPSPSLFYVKPFAERTKQLAEQVAEGSDITINIDINPSDLILYADESLVAHVANNLMKNAIQAIHQSVNPHGNVWLKAYANADESITIAVSDDGPLIPDDVAQHIFVPFFTTKKDGSGIGLSVSRQIMRLSGGTLSLKSDHHQGLTTFEMIFP